MTPSKLYLLLIAVLVLNLVESQKTLTVAPTAPSSGGCCCSTIQDQPTLDISNYNDAFHYGVSLLRKVNTTREYIIGFNKMPHLFVKNVFGRYKHTNNVSQAFQDFLKLAPFTREEYYDCAYCVKYPRLNPKLEIPQLDSSSYDSYPGSRWITIYGTTITIPYRGPAPPTRTKDYPQVTYDHLEQIRQLLKAGPAPTFTDNDFVIFQDEYEQFPQDDVALLDLKTEVDCKRGYASWFRNQIKKTKWDTPQPLADWLLKLNLPLGFEEEVYTRWMSTFMDSLFRYTDLPDLICEDGFTGTCDKSC